MKDIFTIFIIISSFNCLAQKLPSNLDECSQLLLSTKKAGENIKNHEIELLLSSVNSLCLQSTEYSEWVNEIIYKLIIIKPEGFIASFNKQSTNIQKNVLKEIESPIHDGIDLEASYNSIKSTNSQNSESILKAIHTAGEKIDLNLH